MSPDTMTIAEEMRCARHPSVETGLTCSICGTPICPKCMVVAPVGMKCPDCGRTKNSPLFKVSPQRLILAGLAALVAGAVAALISELRFFVIFVSIPYGYFAGGMILKAAGMKRGLKIEILTGVCMVLAAIAAKLGPAVMRVQHLDVRGVSAVYAALPELGNPFFWIAVIIATSCAVSKIRHL